MELDGDAFFFFFYGCQSVFIILLINVYEMKLLCFISFKLPFSLELFLSKFRTEVKAAMMRFSVRLVAVLYKRAPEPHNNDSVSRVSFGQDEVWRLA